MMTYFLIKKEKKNTGSKMRNKLEEKDPRQDEVGKYGINQTEDDDD